MPARKRLDSQMYPLMPLKIVIPIEALRTLIAPERPIVDLGLLLRVAVHMMHGRRVPAVVRGHHAIWETAYEGELAAWVVDVGENRPVSGERVAVGSVLLVGVILWRCGERRH